MCQLELVLLSVTPSFHSPVLLHLRKCTGCAFSQVNHHCALFPLIGRFFFFAFNLSPGISPLFIGAKKLHWIEYDTVTTGSHTPRPTPVSIENWRFSTAGMLTDGERRAIASVCRQTTDTGLAPATSPPSTWTPNLVIDRRLTALLFTSLGRHPNKLIALAVSVLYLITVKRLPSLSPSLL